MVLSVLAAAIPLVVVAYMLGVKKIPSHKSTSAGGLAGKEGDLFRAVLGYSLALTAVAGTLAMLQAYVFPFVIPVVK
jgi:L-lactate permease